MKDILPPEDVVPLLGPGDPAPFRVLNPDSDSPLFLICDHAGQAVPKNLGTMGVKDGDLDRHWAVDIGARAVTEKLASMTGATAILAEYSRVVVDLNRPPDHPTTFVPQGEGQPIPGNIGITSEDRARRLREIYDPYHAAIEILLDRYAARNIIPVILSVHSFTPVFYQARRPWQFCVMWAQDDRIAKPMMAHFRAMGYCVGDNEPYDARAIYGSTTGRHGDGRRLPNVLVEIRNDMIDHPDGAAQWAGYLYDFMTKILADAAQMTLYQGPALAYDPELARTYFETLNARARSDNAPTPPQGEKNA